MSSRLKKYHWKELRYPFGGPSTSSVFDFLIRSMQNAGGDDNIITLPEFRIYSEYEEGTAFEEYFAYSAARDTNAKTLRLSMKIK